MSDRASPWWRNPTKLPFVLFLAIGGYFLWTEHQPHLVEYLPWLLMLGCLGMHFFMHRGHGHGRGNTHGADRDDVPRAEDDRGHER